MLINNPTALAIHECQCLWPDVPLQCVVSLGTGRFQTTGRTSVSSTSLKTKLSHIISSATATEGQTHSPSSQLGCLDIFLTLSFSLFLLCYRCSEFESRSHSPFLCHTLPSDSNYCPINTKAKRPKINLKIKAFCSFFFAFF